MRSTGSMLDLYACESNVTSSYDDDFAALYRSVWDTYLGDRQEKLLSQLFEELPFPVSILDAAAGTGELAIRLARRGQRVTANELSDSMRSYIHKLKCGNDCSDLLEVVEPGVCWRSLPAALGNRSFGLVICIGAALAHCDNSATGILHESLSALVSLVNPDGFLLVDCKRYAEDGCELMGDGRKRPLEIADSEAVEWSDVQGNRRSGTLRSSFCKDCDRTLTRIFQYQEFGIATDRNRRWTFRTWPVAKAEICDIVSSGGLRLVLEKVVGGTANKLPVDTLLFRKELQP